MKARRRLLWQMGAFGAWAWSRPALARARVEQEGAHPMTGETQAGWQLAEDSAEAYERYLVPAIFVEMADRLLDLAEVGQGARMLDVGCGTGIVARRAAPRVGAAGRLTALDLNEDMLRVARRVSQGLRPAIEWRQGDALALPFADGSFDVVVCQQALQFFQDPERGLREMRRVTAPGGRVVAAVLRPIRYSPPYGPLADALERHVGREAGAMMRSPFPAWDRDAVKGLAGRAGLRDPHVRIVVGAVRYPSPAEMLRQEAASSPLAGPLRALPAATRESLVRDLEGALAEFVDDAGLAFPLETFVARARA
jgi:SAM-dependent methyltransferase